MTAISGILMDGPGAGYAYEMGWIRPVTEERRCREFLGRLNAPVRFALVVGSTQTAQIDGISAAGATPFMRRYTAALDAEYLVHGRPLTMPDVPRNPLGPPSPVLISRASLMTLGLTALVIDAGCEISPLTPRLLLGTGPGRSIVTGNSLSLPADFVRTCKAAARMIANPGGVTVLAESVPGGTTTACSVLEALGVNALGRVSSSMPGGNHARKEEVVKSALDAAALGSDPDALLVAARVGDPMQPVVALLALTASLTGTVVLGGGTQMAAVWALIVKLHREGHEGSLENICLATTRWVAEDSHSDLAGLLGQIDPPPAAFSASLDFSGCRSPGLVRYEEGLVKEGVGAGAAAFMALANQRATLEELTEHIDRLAEKLDEPDENP